MTIPSTSMSLLAIRAGVVAASLLLAPLAAAQTAPKPWFAAARDGDVAALTAFLRAGLDVNAVSADDHGATALMLAAQFARRPAVEVLLDARADVARATPDGWTALMAAAEGGTFWIADALVQRGAGVNDRVTGTGYTALMKAVAHGHYDVAAMLVAKKAEVNARTESGLTPLVLAAWEGRLEITKLLLAHGADLTAKYKDGRTPVAIAETRGHFDVARLLRAAGGRH